MAHRDQTPQLTPNNRIYLYQLLSRELGCGRQTFMPAVEEVLAADRMTAEDLGFESTRALLEVLEDFIKLTVFKGGRVYATVIAQPAWDEALSALESGKSKDAGNAKSNKPWKRKKTDKALKPVRPKRVKRPAPEPAQEPESKPEPESAPERKPVPEPKPESAPAPVTEPATEPVIEQAPANAPTPDHEHDAPKAEPAKSAPAPDEGAEGEALVGGVAVAVEAETEVAPSPAISLTVTYDPYRGIDRETKLESHPVAPKAAKAPQKPAYAPSDPSADAPASTGESEAPAPARPVAPASQAAEPARPVAPAPQAVAPAPQAAATPQAPAARPQPAEPMHAIPDPEPKEPAPEVLATYPVDFPTEVYLASERIADLCELLPYGTDVFTLLAEDYDRARSLGLVGGTRARATFPLRIQHVDSIVPILITLKRRTGTGLSWELSSIA